MNDDYIKGVRRNGQEDADLYTDYESIVDIARGDGFRIDDDGHWIPLDAEDGYGEYGEYIDRSDYDIDVSPCDFEP